MDIQIQTWADNIERVLVFLREYGYWCRVVEIGQRLTMEGPQLRAILDFLVEQGVVVRDNQGGTRTHYRALTDEELMA